MTSKESHRLIARLIEERAIVIAHSRVTRACHLTVYPSEADRDQARREIEEVLREGRK